mmetsp:Transcript_9312/g.22889  ORF Transcript_9312/g.22889 Transcript_9312/m.22889 type:complete len:647 (-) Transcript_9312:366-2306(-)|eukprot:CAMPEP_0179000090 /NCGR_PEP_ID=MMETSP0795-20121207/10463_1 /TAXON_ID=88552 /ORGANISM="Amoebophrya sp., Strain Ameob2" /LENGTH=646 /DNA_ID=CAMNT_0020693017 /DNA_START=92 /DNA_END=2032 /DNA_ORIENTATION=+
MPRVALQGDPLQLSSSTSTHFLLAKRALRSTRRDRTSCLLAEETEPCFRARRLWALGNGFAVVAAPPDERDLDPDFLCAFLPGEDDATAFCEHAESTSNNGSSGQHGATPPSLPGSTRASFGRKEQAETESKQERRTTTEKNSAYLESLPTHAWVDVLLYLPAVDWLALAQTCSTCSGSFFPRLVSGALDLLRARISPGQLLLASRQPTRLRATTQHNNELERALRLLARLENCYDFDVFFHRRPKTAASVEKVVCADVRGRQNFEPIRDLVKRHFRAPEKHAGKLDIQVWNQHRGYCVDHAWLDPVDLLNNGSTTGATLQQLADGNGEGFCRFTATVDEQRDGPMHEDYRIRRRNIGENYFHGGAEVENGDGRRGHINFYNLFPGGQLVRRVLGWDRRDDDNVLARRGLRRDEAALHRIGKTSKKWIRPVQLPFIPRRIAITFRVVGTAGTSTTAFRFRDKEGSSIAGVELQSKPRSSSKRFPNFTASSAAAGCDPEDGRSEKLNGGSRKVSLLAGVLVKRRCRGNKHFAKKSNVIGIASSFASRVLRLRGNKFLQNEEHHDRGETKNAPKPPTGRVDTEKKWCTVELLFSDGREHYDVAFGGEVVLRKMTTERVKFGLHTAEIIAEQSGAGTIFVDVKEILYAP